MTRLFLRFYVGVICILLMAWLIQGIVINQTSSSENVQVVEQALSGGVRLALRQLDAASEPQAGKAFTSLQGDFEYPVQWLELEGMAIRQGHRDRLREGQIVFYNRAGQGYVAGAFADRQRVLEFGPLPSFVGPSQTVVTLGFGAVLLLAAVAIAILLRPVAAQLRAVEKTASAIAAGDLSARIPSSQVPKGLPLAHAFNAMAARMQQLLNKQRELLQAVSHELRTPLARIRFATDLIESAGSVQERARRIAAVDRATQELDELVGELLTYIRLDPSSTACLQEDFNLYELAKEVLETWQPLCPAIEFTLQASPAAEALCLRGERNSVGRALGNLVGNAGKFARQRVAIYLRLEEDGVHIDVDDDGPGVPLNERLRIFEPFVRLAGSPEHGAGLGLALVTRIVESQQGTIRVCDSPLGGARFACVLPRPV